MFLQHPHISLNSKYIEKIGDLKFLVLIRINQIQQLILGIGFLPKHGIKVLI